MSFDKRITQQVEKVNRKGQIIGHQNQSPKKGHRPPQHSPTHTQEEDSPLRTLSNERS